MDAHIAVVGIGCRYPGANSPVEFIENLVAGRRYFRRVPAERWSIDEYYNRNGSSSDTISTRIAALIENFDFEHASFKILRRTFEATDMAQWLALQTALEAYLDCRVRDVPRDSTAVILGNTLAGETSRAQILRYRWPYTRRVFAELLHNLSVPEDAQAYVMEQVEARYKSPFPPTTEDSLAGSLANTIAGRICNYFDFHGGGYTIDGACSSSLLAVAQGCSQLVSGDVDLVFAGGVDISLDPFELVGFSRVGVLSDDDMRVYDQRGNGFFPGEGCGIVVLKRLDDAVAQGDRIYSIIRGWGYSSDGKGGLTTPSIEGQAFAIARAYQRAGYTLADVGLIEGHGTGTPVGDRTEISALGLTMQRHGVPADHRCGMGSVKSNIGHTKAAAGVAGFIKAALSVYYGIMPPTMGVQMPNAVFGSHPNLFPLRKGRRWNGEAKRRAGVCSAGFGGINVHVTMEGWDDADPQVQVETQRLLTLLPSPQSSEVFFLSAAHPEAMAEALVHLGEAAQKISFAQLTDLAASCAHRAKHSQLRAALVASSPRMLTAQVAQMQALLQATPAHRLNHVDVEQGLYFRSDFKMPRVVFLFPGQGSQRLNMGDVWHARFPFLQDFWQQCDDVLEDLLPAPLSSYVFRDTDREQEAAQQEWREALSDTAIAQPAIVAASMAMAKLLRYFGLEPHMALGHSLGEYSALWNAGALGTTAALRLVAQRGRAMAMPAGHAGTMMSIAAPADHVRRLLSDVLGYVTIANINAPDQTVVSGERAAIDLLFELCQHQGVLATVLPVSNAFHSDIVSAAQDALAEPLRAVAFKPMQHLVVSSVTGTFIAPGTDLADLMTRQITAPVQFQQALATCLDEDADLFIEVGPRAVLSRLTRRNNPDPHRLAFSTDAASLGDDPVYHLNHLLAYAFTSGMSVRVDRVFENRFVREIALPYQPRFITSPCERDVEPLDLKLDLRLEASYGADGSNGALPVSIVPHTDAAPSSNGVAAEAQDAGQASDEQSVLRALTQYIVKQFGFPEEMVTAASELSEDLNLDSIKMAELVVAVAEQLHLMHQDPLALLGGTVTLGDLAARIATQTQDGDGPADATPAEDSATAERAPWVRAFETRVVEQPLTGTVFDWADGPVLVAALEASPLLEALSAALDAAGRSYVVHLGDGADLPTEGLAGGIVVAPRVAEVDPLDAALPEDAEAALFRFPHLLRQAAQAMMAASEASEGRFFGVLVQGNGRLGRAGDLTSASDYLAAGGFVKTLSQEQPHLRTRLIDLEEGLTPADMAALALAELRTGEGHREAGYAFDETRYAPQVFPVSVPALPEQPWPLAPGDVVLVTGGGKGITAECMLAMARTYDLRLALTGRSPRPEAEGDAGELALNLRRFAAAGLAVRYYSCDVTDAAAVQALVADVEADLGPIAGLVHAAGANTPRRIEHATADAFAAVLRPKMLGLAHLLDALGLARLKLVLGFSSIIGHSGMAGNSDYAYANAWLNHVINRLAEAHPAMQARAYGFSVWDDVGMGVRLGSVAALAKMGIGAIPATDGVQRFMDLLGRAWPAPDLIVAAPLGHLVGTLPFARPTFEKERFLEQVVRHQPGVELVTEAQLQPGEDRYLDEHDYEGALLFPAVLGIEAMVQVATACLSLPGERPTTRPVLEDLVFHRPIVVPAQGRAVRVYAVADDGALDGSRRVQVALRSSVTNFEVDYFAGTCVWPAEAPALTAERPAWPEPLPINVADDLYGSLFFQGPMFQNIAAYHDLSSTHCLASIRVPAEARAFPGTFGGSLLTASPQVRDAFLHAVQLCVPQHKILPLSMERVVIHGFPGEEVYLYAQERSRTETDFIYDLQVFDEQGHCVEVLEGFRCRIVDRYRDAAALQRFEEMHALAARRNVHA